MDHDYSTPGTRVFIEAQQARLFEHVEAIHIRRQAEEYARLHPGHIEHFLIQPAPKGGVLIRTAVELTGKLNRAVGAGEDGELDSSDIEQVEMIFKAIGLGSEIHLSPFASSGTIKTLLSRGYAYWGRLNTYWCKVDELVGKQTPSSQTSSPSDVSIRVVSSAEIEQFLEAAVAGFKDGGRSPELLRQLAELAAYRQDTVLYLAEVDGQIAGSAAMANIETADATVAHLYMDSTIPRYRGRGVQRQLIQSRLRDANREGVQLATSITRAASGSARNAERAGLSLAYTTSMFHRPCQ